MDDSQSSRERKQQLSMCAEYLQKLRQEAHCARITFQEVRPFINTPGKYIWCPYPSRHEHSVEAQQTRKPASERERGVKHINPPLAPLFSTRRLDGGRNAKISVASSGHATRCSSPPPSLRCKNIRTRCRPSPGRCWWSTPRLVELDPDSNPPPTRLVGIPPTCSALSMQSSPPVQAFLKLTSDKRSKGECDVHMSG